MPSLLSAPATGSYRIGCKAKTYMYRCPAHYKGSLDCQRPQMIAERKALIACQVRFAEFLTAPDGLLDLASRVLARLGQGAYTSIHHDLTLVSERIAYLTKTWLQDPDMPKVPKAVKQELLDLEARQESLQAEARALSADHELSLRAAEIVQLFSARGIPPERIFALMEPAQ
jgi:hypothetical protein